MENMPSTVQAMQDYRRYAEAQIERNNKQNDKLKQEIADINIKLKQIQYDAIGGINND